jgi:hypothetical protein
MPVLRRLRNFDRPAPQNSPTSAFHPMLSLHGRQDFQPGILGAAARAFEAAGEGAERLRSAELGGLVAVQRTGGAAAAALDPQPRPEPDEIGDGTNVLGGHRPRLGG